MEKFSCVYVNEVKTTAVKICQLVKLYFYLKKLLNEALLYGGFYIKFFLATYTAKFPIFNSLVYTRNKFPQICK